MTNRITIGGNSVLSKDLQLSNGVTLSNRIAQSAMTEHLATGDGAPSWQLIEAYRRFAVSGAALIISGNVMVNGWSLEAPRNVVIEDDRHTRALRRWAGSTTGTDAQLILQLSLPGRQTQRGLALAGRRQDVATASAVPLSIGGPRSPSALAPTMFDGAQSAQVRKSRTRSQRSGPGTPEDASRRSRPPDGCPYFGPSRWGWTSQPARATLHSYRRFDSRSMPPASGYLCWSDLG
ncbi:MAG: hypothetical protein QOE48_2749, partial [Mycobacterium sp.]|jgi:hypothetical protein|nr:hypothetical protein [Mycobacterium sp.]